MTMRRRMSAVLLAGSYIITCEQLGLGWSVGYQHSSNVLMRVLLTPAAFLLSGVIYGNRTAGCMTSIINVCHLVVSHNLKSSDSVIWYQVSDVITFVFYRISQSPRPESQNPIHIRHSITCNRPHIINTTQYNTILYSKCNKVDLTCHNNVTGID